MSRAAVPSFGIFRGDRAALNPTVEFDPSQIMTVLRGLHGTGEDVRRNLGAIVNDTTKDVRTRMSSDIRQRINIRKRDVDRHIRFTRATGSGHAVNATVSLRESARPGLIAFGARQTRAGVSYRIRVGGVVSRVRSAFIATVWGSTRPGTSGHSSGLSMSIYRRAKGGRGHEGVFMRVGKARLPIRELKGASPWGVHVRNNLMPETVEFARQRLAENTRKRLRFITLRAMGAIHGRTGVAIGGGSVSLITGAVESGAD